MFTTAKNDVPVFLMYLHRIPLNDVHNVQCPRFVKSHQGLIPLKFWISGYTPFINSVIYYQVLIVLSISFSDIAFAFSQCERYLRSRFRNFKLFITQRFCVLFVGYCETRIGTRMLLGINTYIFLFHYSYCNIILQTSDRFNTFSSYTLTMAIHF